MPAGLIAALPAIFAGVGAGTALGTGIYSLENQPGAPKPTNPAAVTSTGQAAEKAAIGQQLPTLQSQVGGSVSPEYYQQIAQLLSGTANQPGSGASANTAVGSFFGNSGTNGGPSAGLTTSTGTNSGGLTSGGSSNIVSDGIAELTRQFPGLS
jgi:hypothetical protein